MSCDALQSAATESCLCRERGVSLSQGYVIGVDMGGTNTRLVAFSLEEFIVAEYNRPTPKSGDGLLVTNLTSMIEDFIKRANLSRENLRAIGMGVPGAVDIECGCIFLAPNLGVMERHPIRVPLEEYFGVPVELDNDVNMAALGEQAYGIAKGVSSFVFLAVGTGIGAAMVLDNRLYRGSRYCAGEIGYMVFDNDFLAPADSDRGYLELVASGEGIAERASNRLAGSDRDATNTQKVFENAVAGDVVAKEVINEAVSALSLAIANTVILLDPQLVVLGGGVLTKTERIDELERNVNRLVPHKTEIRLSSLGERAQLYGTVAVALDVAKRRAGAG